MVRIRGRAQNVFNVSLNYSYQLRNTETGVVMLYYKEIRISPLFQALEKAV